MRLGPDSMQSNKWSGCAGNQVVSLPSRVSFKTLISSFPPSIYLFDAVQQGDTSFSFVLVALYVRYAISQKMHFPCAMKHP